MKSKYAFAFTLCLLLLLVGVGVVSAQEGAAAGSVTDSAWIALAAGGATAEKPEVFGRVLIFVALAEAIAIYGLLIAFMLWTKI